MNQSKTALAQFLSDGEEPVFSAPWEAHAFALAVKLHDLGLFEWSDWSTTLSEVIALNADNSVGYYENWLQALERIVTKKGIIDAQAYQCAIDTIKAEV